MADERRDQRPARDGGPGNGGRGSSRDDRRGGGAPAGRGRGQGGSSAPRSGQSSGGGRAPGQSGERPKWGDKPRSNDSRPQRSGDDRRPPREGDRYAKDSRGRSDDRPQRSSDGRPQRSNDSRPPRTGDDRRPRRADDRRGAGQSSERPKWGDKPRSNDGRPARSGEGRPQRASDGRPPRSGEGRPQRSYDARSNDQRSYGSRPPRGDDRYSKDSRGGGDRRPSRPGEDRRPQRDDRYSKDSRGRSGDRPQRGGSDRPWSRDRDERIDIPRTETQAVYDGPPIPEEITGRELDHNVLAHLKGLPDKLAQRVARHLVAAGQLIDEDPEVAYQHTLAARARAARLAVVREAVGEAAYAAGHYAEALSELRAAKRMNGRTDYLAVMADCHRAMGQPDKALKLAKSPGVKNYTSEARAEMTIVEAGARRDLGQMDAALRTLELSPINSKSREVWVVRLRYAYADALEAAGQETEALSWFHRTYAIDADQTTDAAERAAALEAKRD